MSSLKDGAPMGQSGAGIGPSDPSKEKSAGAAFFKAVEKDLQKRFGKNGKNPPFKKGNKIVS